MNQLEGRGNFSLDFRVTFDDVLILPQYSEVLPTEADTRVQLSENLFLNIPILSSAMDTVTEAQTSIALAQEGGLGIIHKNIDVDKQAQHVRRVKKFESGVILNPLKIQKNLTIRDVKNLMVENGISGFPVLDGSELVGIITNRDLRFEIDPDQPVTKIMTPFEKLITASEDVTLEKARAIMKKHRIEKLPLIDGMRRLVGLITYKDLHNLETHPNAIKDSSGRLKAGAAIGALPRDVERAEALVSEGIDVLVVDTAHGHSQMVLDQVKRIRDAFPDLTLIAGNVGTASATAALIEAGADVVKVGVGPGSICTTRIISGVGVPQLSAILECAKKARSMGKTVVADGGIRYSGDIVKALAAGSSAVMIGSLFAGTNESPGELVYYQGRSYKNYRGMGSLGAMKSQSADRYPNKHLRITNLAADALEPKLVPEGVEGRVPHVGSLSSVLFQLTGGLKSGMGYIGASNIRELQERARFVRISNHAIQESHVHNIHITTEAPNYILSP